MARDELLEYLLSQQKEFLNMLKELVELESPSHENKEIADKCGRFLENAFEQLGFRIERIHQEKCGDHIYGEIGSGKKSVLIVGHYDTVFPIGTIKSMPFMMKDGKAHGPGILDMKSGIIMAYFAIKALKDLNLMPDRRIGVFFNSDEESGSFHSKDHILQKAYQYENVFVMEPGVNDIHSIKTGRYGRGTYSLIAHGKSAHSGSNPHLAINPLIELAHQLVRIEKWNRDIDGVTFAPTTIKGGIVGTCMVPESACFTMDVRYETTEVSKAIHEKLMEMDALTPGARLEVKGEIDKPVMLANNELIEKAKKAGERYGLHLKEVTVGGGSDGNFTSAAGIPTLDGLGGTGEFLHNPAEYIHIDHVPYRTAMVSRLLQTL